MCIGGEVRTLDLHLQELAKNLLVYRGVYTTVIVLIVWCLHTSSPLLGSSGVPAFILGFRNYPFLASKRSGIPVLAFVFIALPKMHDKNLFLSYNLLVIHHHHK